MMGSAGTASTGTNSLANLLGGGLGGAGFSGGLNLGGGGGQKTGGIPGVFTENNVASRPGYQMVPLGAI